MANEARYKINKIFCPICESTAESLRVHHMCSCLCGSVSADGGPEYLRRAGEDYIELSERVDGKPLTVGVDVSEGTEIGMPKGEDDTDKLPLPKRSKI